MSTETRKLRVTGMDCASCARTVETGVARLEGVSACSLNFATETLVIEGDVSVESLATRVRELGYGLEEVTGGRTPERSEASNHFLAYLWERGDTRLALVGAILILPGLIFNELLPGLGFENPVLDIMSVLAMVTAGFPIARSAWKSVRINRELNINALMTIAAIGAVLIGAYSEAGLVMVLFALGEALEGYTAARARNSIRGLMEVVPNEAIVLRPCLDCEGHLGQDGYTGGPCPFCGVEEQRVPVEELQLGETIVVRPGERIPMDGRVLEGYSTVNQAPITGESMPLGKAPGDDVFASSVNGEGVLQLEITHLAEDNTISRMIELVEAAQEKRADTQRFVDRFARVYTPAVVVLAALVALVPPLFFGQPFWSAEVPSQGWIYRALALLVVACPCALVISTPVTIISAISNAARNGVLIKGGIFLEKLGQIKVIAFDKTGTLTSGQPTVVSVRAVNCTDELTGQCVNCDELLALAHAVEQRSEHPLARAVAEASFARGLDRTYPAAAGVRALTGQGVVGQVNEQEVLIGSHRYFDEHVPHATEACLALQDAAEKGQTSLLVSSDDRYLGYITVADTVRPTAPFIMHELQQRGVEHLVMLTGDDDATAQAIASEVGVTDVRAGLLPEDKLAAVEELRAQYGPVAMVGDGINDAPALAAADIGIAMGAAGTAQALETADIALMADDIGKLPFAVHLGHAAMRTIHVNVALSLGIKLLFLIIVLLGAGTMWMAVLADMGASLLVTLNGTRLLSRPKPDVVVNTQRSG